MYLLVVLRHPKALLIKTFGFFVPERSPICGFLLRIIRHDRLGRRHLGIEVKMRVNVARRGNVAVTEPLLNILQRHAVGIKQSRAGMAQIVEADAAHPVILKKRRERLRQIVHEKAAVRQRLVHQRRGVNGIKALPLSVTDASGMSKTMTSFGLFSPFLEFVLMTNPPLINLRIAPYVIPDKRDMFQAAEVRLLPLIFLRKMGRKHGENSTVFVNVQLPKTLIFQGFSTREVPNSTGDSGSELLPCI